MMILKHVLTMAEVGFVQLPLLAKIEIETVLGVAFMILVLVISTVVKSKKKEKLIDSYFNFSRDKENNSIVLKQRAVDNRNYISFKRFQQEYRKDHDAQLVYTGASVGGVHTGGFHVEDAYTTVHGGAVTDRYYFWVSGGEESFLLKKVILNDDLINDAKRHLVVSRFLKGNTLVLEYDNENTKLTDEENAIHSRAMKNHDMTTMVNISMRAMTEKKLKKDDAKAVLDWLCGS